MAGDKTFGLNNRGGEFFRGNASVDFDGDDLVIDGNKYKGTQGLRDLITMKKTVLGLATEEDMRNYEQIMLNSEAMRNRKNPKKKTANKRYKWQNIIRPMWNKYEKKTNQKVKRWRKAGSGFLPSDPNSLCERVELLMASKQAGNTSFRNEIISICDEQSRQKFLPSDAYKKHILKLNKDVNH